MDRFREWLASNNYRYIEQIVNCADIGLPQTRIRYFLMAVKGNRKLNYLPLTYSKADYHQLDLFGNNKQPWNNWYDAIADLIPDMQLTDLSDNQRLALAEYKAKNAVLIEGRTRSRAENGRQDRLAVRDRLDPAITVLAGIAASAQIPKLLIPTIGYHSDLPPIYTDKKPAPTVKAAMLSDGESDRKSCWRLIGNCEVREMSIRALARLQGFPDDLILSGSKSLDCRAIGNAVPPIAMQRILENCF
jgi:site-specific DNA-cytosine methylase